MAKRRRHTPDQIIRKLAEGNKLLAEAELDKKRRKRMVGTGCRFNDVDSIFIDSLLQAQVLIGARSQSTRRAPTSPLALRRRSLPSPRSPLLATPDGHRHRPG